MRARTAGREIWAGLVVVLALGAMFGLFALAGGGPGFMTDPVESSLCRSVPGSRRQLEGRPTFEESLRQEHTATEV